jgi:hypothetical protein
MAGSLSRRDALIRLGGAGAASWLPTGTIRGADTDIVVGGRPVEIGVASVSASTVRITLRPIENGRAVEVPSTGELEKHAIGAPGTRARSASGVRDMAAGDLVVRFTASPPTLHVATRTGVPVQRLTLDAKETAVSFLLPKGPLLGLGEGGPQFDRKGSTDAMINGQGGYKERTHGARVPIPWVIGTAAFALLASVALHDKKAPDAPFLKSFNLIEREATDSRNFVRKAVNWALRGIGGRNPALFDASREVAERLAASADSTARWNGKDALRQLAGAASQKRLAAQKKKAKS